MNALAASSDGDAFDEKALLRGVASVGHPLTRALLVFTFTTGLVDGVSYLGLGRVFTANMTGNVVLLGFGVAGSGGLPVLAPIVSLASYLIGAVVGGRLIRHFVGRHPRLVASAVGLEVSLVAAAAVVAAVTHVKVGHLAAYVVIALLALAMGMRSTVVRQFGVPDISTVVLTMTLTALASESPLAGGAGRGSIRRVITVVAMFAGALSSALLLKTRLFLPLALAAVLALVTGLIYLPAAVRLGRTRSSGPR
jgi:uncharacterized membrane protein YoaK (UPF0700 family)